MSTFDPATILELPQDNITEFELSLISLLVHHSDGGIATVREFRDGFPKINRSVKAGCVKVIGKSPGDQTVLLSISQLADMLKLASGKLTFGESLAMAGFEGGWSRIAFDEIADHPEEFEL
jgi:hypothetical protein